MLALHRFSDLKMLQNLILIQEMLWKEVATKCKHFSWHQDVKLKQYCNEKIYFWHNHDCNFFYVNPLSLMWHKNPLQLVLTSQGWLPYWITHVLQPFTSKWWWFVFVLCWTVVLCKDNKKWLMYFPKFNLLICQR